MSSINWESRYWCGNDKGCGCRCGNSAGGGAEAKDTKADDGSTDVSIWVHETDSPELTESEIRIW